MRRRRFLAAAAAEALAGAAGCSRLDVPAVPPGMTVETRHWVADVLVDGLWSRRQAGGTPPDHYHAVLADEAAVRERVDEEVETGGFFGATAFDRSYVLVVQTLMQSARWLERRRVERRAAGLRVAVVTRSPDEPYGDDAAVHSLAVRVTDERAGPPDRLDVTVDGEPTDH